jgi:hypothetical protein
MSSIASVDSHISSYSNLSSWSTTYNGSNTDSDPSMGLDIVYTALDNGRVHSRAQSLSIDPKLFQPRFGNGSIIASLGDRESGAEESMSDGEAGEDGQKTAVPKIPKTPASGGPMSGTMKKATARKPKMGLPDSGDKKKVSHARKVSHDTLQTSQL